MPALSMSKGLRSDPLFKKKDSAYSPSGYKRDINKFAKPTVLKFTDFQLPEVKLCCTGV